MASIDLLRPGSASEVSNLLADGRPIAGGTDILVQHRAGRRSTALVDLTAIAAEVPLITRDDGWTMLSALAPLTALRSVAPTELKGAIDEFASTTIRNRATLGGNLANGSPAADTVPALLVLGAEVVARAGDSRRRVAIADFLAGPGQVDLGEHEWIESIRFRDPSGVSGFRKVGGRRAQAISFLNLAWRCEMRGRHLTNIRLAMGAVAPTVRRLATVEAAIDSKELTTDVIEEAAELVSADISPISDVRASSGYRLRCASGLIRELLTGILLQLEETKT